MPAEFRRNHHPAKTISRPKIVTQDNEEALIRQGAKIPVQTVINNTPTTTFIDALLRLTVTPRVTEDGNIFLTVDVENSTPAPWCPARGVGNAGDRHAASFHQNLVPTEAPWSSAASPCRRRQSRRRRFRSSAIFRCSVTCLKVVWSPITTMNSSS